ncbi:ankyrin repeat domain-containing protein 17 isoform X3 [Hyalella azteca]|uniref:Ankyrin repeat domain-containing protein 17 isoform X3 n=1 Tax=Hyalella azteca TaxID=294128 RepID=A0A8B7PJQ0_HYAAZ|nr:ankyrin repeat domain-containing protein 17 isoform X3 [Hyalella azteca]
MQDVAKVSVSDSEKETQSSLNSDCNSIVASDTSSRNTNKHPTFAQLDDKCSSSAESESEDEDISEVESFVLGDAEEEVVVASLDNQFLRTAAAAAAAAGGSSAARELVVGLEAAVAAAGVGDAAPQGSHFDPETQARLVALLEAAAGGCAGRSLVEACSDGDVLAVRRLLDEGRSVHETTEEGESLLSLACSAGYYDLAQVLLAMRANVEDRGFKGDCTPLMEAASAGHADIVRLLLSHNAEVNAQSSSGNTPLMYACAAGHTEVVKLLLEHNANVEDHNENGHTPLMEAASAGHVEVAQLLLEEGAGINTSSDEFKESALTLACYKGHMQMVEFLLDAGADQEHKTDEMHTALMEACMDGHVEVAKLLLDHGAQVNMPADSFESPLTLAACGGHTVLAHLLLERGANIEEVNDEGYTPLMEAAREGHEDMVRLLLKLKIRDKGNKKSPESQLPKLRASIPAAKVNVQTEETQETALTLACCGGFKEVAQILVSQGADLELGASTPLIEAAQEGHRDLVEFLLSKRANVNAQTSTGDTALTYACENGHTSVVDVLLRAGADLEHQSEGGRTPLMKACRAGHLCTVQFLLLKGAQVNRSTSENDHTPLSLACGGGHLKIVDLLLTYGADPTHVLKDNCTMVMEAAKGGHTAVVRLLLEYPNNVGHVSAQVAPGAALTGLSSLPPSDQLSAAHVGCGGDSCLAPSTTASTISHMNCSGSTCRLPPPLPSVPSSAESMESNFSGTASGNSSVGTHCSTSKCSVNDKGTNASVAEAMATAYALGVSYAISSATNTPAVFSTTPNTNFAYTPAVVAAAKPVVRPANPTNKAKKQQKTPNNPASSAVSVQQTKLIEELHRVEQRLEKHVKLQHQPCHEHAKLRAQQPCHEQAKLEEKLETVEMIQQRIDENTHALSRDVDELMQAMDNISSSCSNSSVSDSTSSSDSAVSAIGVDCNVSTSMSSALQFQSSPLHSLASLATHTVETQTGSFIPSHNWMVVPGVVPAGVIPGVVPTLGIHSSAGSGSITTPEPIYSPSQSGLTSVGSITPTLPLSLAVEGCSMGLAATPNVSLASLASTALCHPDSQLTQPPPCFMPTSPAANAIPQTVPPPHYTTTTTVPVSERKIMVPSSKKNDRKKQIKQQQLLQMQIQQQQQQMQHQTQAKGASPVISNKSAAGCFASPPCSSHGSALSSVVGGNNINSNNVSSITGSAKPRGDNKRSVPIDCDCGMPHPNNPVSSLASIMSDDLLLTHKIPAGLFQQQTSVPTSGVSSVSSMKPEVRQFLVQQQDHMQGASNVSKNAPMNVPCSQSFPSVIPNKNSQTNLSHSIQSCGLQSCVQSCQGVADQSQGVVGAMQVGALQSAVQPNPYSQAAPQGSNKKTKKQPRNPSKLERETRLQHQQQQDQLQHQQIHHQILQRQQQLQAQQQQHLHHHHDQEQLQQLQLQHQLAAAQVLANNQTVDSNGGLIYNNSLSSVTAIGHDGGVACASGTCNLAANVGALHHGLSMNEAASLLLDADPATAAKVIMARCPELASPQVSLDNTLGEPHLTTEEFHQMQQRVATLAVGSTGSTAEYLPADGVCTPEYALTGADVHPVVGCRTPELCPAQYNAATAGIPPQALSNVVEVDAATDSNRDTALTLACAGGYDELVRLLLSRGANIEHRDKKGFTPLILAATAGNVKVVETLLVHGANIEAQSERTKDTPLSLACSGGRFEVVELLLNRSSNKEHRNVSDYTPLSLAASGGYVNIIKLLLDHNAEINSRTGSKLGISPLMLAAMNGHAEAVKTLLNSGSDINAQIETNRNTALTLACFQGRHEVVSLLLDRKANVEHRAKTGLTPLMEAASGGYVEVGEVLIAKGADVNAPPVPSSRDTALTIAADKGHVKFVKLLIEKGAHVEVKNKKGNSAMWLAANGGHYEVVEMLYSSGADIDSQDNRNVSCLMAAFKRAHLKVVKFMVRHVTQFPSDQELQRYIATLTDADMIKKCQACLEHIRAAKDKQALEANKNASNLLKELEIELSREKSKKEAANRRRQKKKAKKKATEEKKEEQKKVVDEDDEDDDEKYEEEEEDDEEEEEEEIEPPPPPPTSRQKKNKNNNKDARRIDKKPPPNNPTKNENKDKPLRGNKNSEERLLPDAAGAEARVPRDECCGAPEERDSGIDSNSQTSATSDTKVQQDKDTKNKKKKKKKEAVTCTVSNKENSSNASSAKQPSNNSTAVENISKNLKNIKLNEVNEKSKLLTSQSNGKENKVLSSSTNHSIPSLSSSNLFSLNNTSAKSGSGISELDTFHDTVSSGNAGAVSSRLSELNICGNHNRNNEFHDSVASLDTFGEAMPPIIPGLMSTPSNVLGVSALSPKKLTSRGQDGWKEVNRKSKKVSVDNAAISRIIGRGGCNINAIREYSGAHIEVEKQGKSQGDRMVIIRGSTEATRRAQNLITALVKEPEKDISELIPKSAPKPSSKNASNATASTSKSLHVLPLSDLIQKKPIPNQVLNGNGAAPKSLLKSAPAAPPIINSWATPASVPCTTASVSPKKDLISKQIPSLVSSTTNGLANSSLAFMESDRALVSCPSSISSVNISGTPLMSAPTMAARIAAQSKSPAARQLFGGDAGTAVSSVPTVAKLNTSQQQLGSMVAQSLANDTACSKSFTLPAGSGKLQQQRKNSLQSNSSTTGPSKIDAPQDHLIQQPMPMKPPQFLGQQALDRGSPVPSLGPLLTEPHINLNILDNDVSQNINGPISATKAPSFCLFDTMSQVSNNVVWGSKERPPVMYEPLPSTPVDASRAPGYRAPGAQSICSSSSISTTIAVTTSSGSVARSAPGTPVASQNVRAVTLNCNRQSAGTPPPMPARPEMSQGLPYPIHTSRTPPPSMSSQIRMPTASMAMPLIQRSFTPPASMPTAVSLPRMQSAPASTLAPGGPSSVRPDIRPIRAPMHQPGNNLDINFIYEQQQQFQQQQYHNMQQPQLHAYSSYSQLSLINTPQFTTPQTNTQHVFTSNLPLSAAPQIQSNLNPNAPDFASRNSNFVSTSFSPRPQMQSRHFQNNTSVGPVCPPFVGLNLNSMDASNLSGVPYSPCDVASLLKSCNQGAANSVNISPLQQSPHTSTPGSPTAGSSLQVQQDDRLSKLRPIGTERAQKRSERTGVMVPPPPPPLNPNVQASLLQHPAPSPLSIAASASSVVGVANANGSAVPGVPMVPNCAGPDMWTSSTMLLADESPNALFMSSADMDLQQNYSNMPVWAHWNANLN